MVRLQLSPHALQLLVVLRRLHVAGEPEHKVSWQLQVPLWQSGAGCEQAEHVAPAVPHSVADWEVYGTQVFPLQHPFAQDVESHTHIPLLWLHS